MDAGIQISSTLLWKAGLFVGVVVLFVLFFRLWLTYIRRLYIDKMDWALLEIKIPRDVQKSPAAMEMMLYALHDTSGTGTWYKRWWLGRVRQWFSLEIVSIEGSIYFFIRTQRKFKDFITSQIYSQYPQAEVQEVDDYTRYLPQYIRENEWDMHGMDMMLVNDDVYPIKTYIDYGMDKDLNLDQEQRIDPITPMLEFLSTMGPGEQIWLQILVRASTTRYLDTDAMWWQFKRRSWVAEGQAVINDFIKKNGTKINSEGKEVNDLQQLTPGQKTTLESLERSLNKHGFDTGVRWIYIAQRDKFRSANIGPMIASFRQYNTPGMNGFRPNSDTETDFDFPWQDISGRRVEKRKEALFDAYVRREFFYHDFFNWPYARHRKQFILNTEELATIFHFPGQVVETPTIQRIDSKKSEPPAKLPI